MRSLYNPFGVTISRDWFPFLSARLLSQFHQQGCWKNSSSFCSTVTICWGCLNFFTFPRQWIFSGWMKLKTQAETKWQITLDSYSEPLVQNKNFDQTLTLIISVCTWKNVAQQFFPCVSTYSANNLTLLIKQRLKTPKCCISFCLLPLIASVFRTHFCLQINNNNNNL